MQAKDRRAKRRDRGPEERRAVRSAAAGRASSLAAASLAAILLVACSGRPARVAALPPPVESATVGPGDVFLLTIVGEDKLPREFRVAPDGTVDLPYVHRVTVAGREPQQIAVLVRDKLIEAGVLRDPSVSIDVREYNSKRVSVLGQVQKPGFFQLRQGLTLVQAISEAGGFNSIANRNRVTLTRLSGQGTRTVVISVDAITEGSEPDVPLQSGDTVFVNERVF